MFLNPFPNAFGLDIGDLSIKAVQLRNISRRGRGQLFQPVAYRSTTLPHGLVMNGIIQEPEKVRKYILHLLEGAPPKEPRIKSDWIFASLPDVQGFLKRIEIDKKIDDIIDEDVRYAAKQHIPFEENEYYLDWQAMPQSESPNRASLLVAAMPKKVADMYTYLLESLGLGVVALEIETLAIARAMITARKTYENEARAILDLGASRSSLTIYDHDQIQYSISLPFSGELITTSLAQKCKLDYEAAERKKISIGLDYDKKSEPCWSVMIEMTDQLIEQTKQAIEFYYSHFPGSSKVTHITLCGGGAAMKRLDQIITTKLGVSAQPGHVWKNVSPNIKIHLSDEESLGYAAAIGLALRAAANPFFAGDAL
ncbi:MAG: type IV pilus assembly protein PilM [Patescibacteria group bacterium]